MGIFAKCSTCGKEIGPKESFGECNEMARQKGWQIVGEFRTESGKIGGCRTMACPKCQEVSKRDPERK